MSITDLVVMSAAVGTAAETSEIWMLTAATIITGIGVTFVVLMLLWFFVAMMGKVLSPKKEEPKPTPKPVVKPQEIPKTVPTPPVVQVATPTPVEVPISPAPVTSEDDAVIAAIAAAVNSMGENLVIKSVRRISDSAEIWAGAGRAQNTRNFNNNEKGGFKRC